MEIEVKVRIENEADLKAKLDGYAKFIKHFTKIDEYYKKEAKIVRCRKEGNNSYFTFKNKKIIDNIEMNDEKETKVENIEVLKEFLRNEGYEIEFTKQKKGYCFEYGNFTFDVSLVNDLGWFLEIEKITTEDRFEETKIQIKEIMSDLGLDEGYIETKSYREMILK